MQARRSTHRVLAISVTSVILTGLLAALSWTSVAAQQPERVDVLITFASAPGPADQALVRGAGGTVSRTYHLVPGMAASLPAASVAALQANPRIVAIEPDGRVQAFDAELDLAWGVQRIGAGDAHASGITGANVKVAVLDSGILYSHPDLAAAYAGGWDFANDDDDPYDDNGHGTHVSGTIAAADNDQGVVGVAPGVQLYAAKVLDASGSGSWSHIIAALEWAVDSQMQVANHSYGDSSNPGTLVAQAFANSMAAGLLNVAAAGNTGDCRAKGNSVGYPARLDDVIAVGATDLFDGRACYSSVGPALELAAPGDFIASTYLLDSYAYGQGTSMASPHVAGAAALLMSAGVLDPAEVRSLLTSTADDFGDPGRDNLYGFGLVNIAKALDLIGNPPPAVNATLSTDHPTYTQADSEALLTLVVTDEMGHPISWLEPDAFTATVDGVAPAFPVSFAEDPDVPGTYIASLSILSLVEGTHTVGVEVQDPEGISGTDTASFLIGSPAAAGTAHVPSIDYSSSGGRGGTRNLYVTVNVVDGDGATVPNASVTVFVYIDGLLQWYGVGSTNTAGQLIFEARNAPTGTYYTEVIDLQAGALIWDGETPPNTFTK